MTDSTPEEPQGFIEPDHPDYERLTDLLARLVDVPAEMAEEEFGFEDLLVEVVDPKSASFVSIQRAIRVLRIGSQAEMVAQLQTVMRVALFWTEGFYAGAMFERERIEAEEGLSG